MKKYICLIFLSITLCCYTEEVYIIKNENDKSHLEKINRIEYIKKNIVYNIDETIYYTDKLSRIYKVIRKESLILSNAKRNNYAQRKIVELYGIKEQDHGGHIIGRQFGGSPNIDNIIPINKNVNTGEMLKMEMEWKDILNNHGKVEDIIIDINYIYTNMRPNIIKINYKVEQDYTNYRIIKIFTNTIITNNCK